MILVATFKPHALSGWGQFFRIKIVEDARGKWWDTIDERNDGSWAMWRPPVKTGRWTYSRLGQIILSPLIMEPRRVEFDNVHWNFKEICQRGTDLTGSGWTFPERSKITWVLGHGLPVMEHRFPDDPDKHLPPPSHGLSHSFFLIRINNGKSPSVAGMQHDTYEIEIFDVLTLQSRKFDYTGTGLALPAPPGTPTVIITDPQPVALFSTTTDVQRLEDFEGDAQMFTDPITGQLRLSIESDTLTLRGTRIVPPGPHVSKGMIELPTDGGGKAIGGGFGAATAGSLDLK
jgi:hypothetical protein